MGKIVGLVFKPGKKKVSEKPVDTTRAEKKPEA
jgi:hypothetical protein